MGISSSFMNTLSTFVSSSFLRHEPSGLLNESLDILCLSLWAVGGFILSFGGFEFNSPTSRPTYLQNLAPLFQAGPLSVIGLWLLNTTRLQKILLPPAFRGFQEPPAPQDHQNLCWFLFLPVMFLCLS